MTGRRSVALLCVAMAWLVLACVERERGTANLNSEHVAVARAPSTDSVPSQADSARYARNTLLEPGALRSVETELVTEWTGPGNQPFQVTVRTIKPADALFRRFGTITLRTSLRQRSPDLGQYPCTSCHLGRGTVLTDKRIADAHQNITAVHPVQTGGVCSTCHAPDNVELLTLKSGARASLNHAYRLCAQCHFREAEAWAGGAHGKRLDGWQGRRVVMGCADCHDPHKPAIEPRIPFRAPHIERGHVK